MWKWHAERAHSFPAMLGFTFTQLNSNTWELLKLCAQIAGIKEDSVFLMDMWVFVYFYPLPYISAKRHHVQTNWSLGLRMRSLSGMS